MWYVIVIGVLILSFIVVKVVRGHKKTRSTDKGECSEATPLAKDPLEEWLLKPDEEFVRCYMAGAYKVLTSTVSFHDFVAGRVKPGQWVDFIVGLTVAGTPALQIGGTVVKSRVTEIENEPVHETMLTDEKNGQHLLLLLGIVISKNAATLMATGVQKRR